MNVPLLILAYCITVYAISVLVAVVTPIHGVRENPFRMAFWSAVVVTVFFAAIVALIALWAYALGTWP